MCADRVAGHRVARARRARAQPAVLASGSRPSAKTVSGYLYWRHASRIGLNCGGNCPPKVPHSRLGPWINPLPGKNSDAPRLLRARLVERLAVERDEPEQVGNRDERVAVDRHRGDVRRRRAAEHLRWRHRAGVGGGVPSRRGPERGQHEAHGPRRRSTSARTQRLNERFTCPLVPATRMGRFRRPSALTCYLRSSRLPKPDTNVRNRGYPPPMRIRRSCWSSPSSPSAPSPQPAETTRSV